MQKLFNFVMQITHKGSRILALLIFTDHSQKKTPKTIAKDILYIFLFTVNSQLERTREH